MKSRWGRLAVLSSLGLGCCFAQADRAALTGTIMDATQAAVPGAHVKVVYPNTGLSRETTTSESGVFRLGGLPIGVCTVEVEATGFQPLKTTAIALNVGETRTLDLTLQVASSKSAVEVTSVIEALQQSNATVGDVLVSSQLNNLPVNGRDWKSLMSLVPGAVNGNQFFSTGGDDINYRVDGTDASGVRDQNMKVYTRLSMSQDAVAEFRVSAGLFSAETGGTPGAQVEVVTKSGSNEFHGSAFADLEGRGGGQACAPRPMGCTNLQRLVCHGCGLCGQQPEHRLRLPGQACNHAGEDGIFRLYPGRVENQAQPDRQSRPAVRLLQ